MSCNTPEWEEWEDKHESWGQRTTEEKDYKKEKTIKLQVSVPLEAHVYLLPPWLFLCSHSSQTLSLLGITLQFCFFSFHLGGKESHLEGKKLRGREGKGSQGVWAGFVRREFLCIRGAGGELQAEIEEEEEGRERGKENARSSALWINI